MNEDDNDVVDVDLDGWPNCSVADCPYKVNLGCGLPLCYPHAYSLPLPEDDGSTWGRE